MDVRSIAKGIFKLPDAKVTNVSRETKLEDSSKDRDANGQQTRDESPEKRKLTPDEIKRSTEYLQGLKGIGENHLTVAIEGEGHFQSFVITGPDGTVIRRIPEYEMLKLLGDQDKPTGQIFRKAG